MRTKKTKINIKKNDIRQHDEEGRKARPALEAFPNHSD